MYLLVPRRHPGTATELGSCSPPSVDSMDAAWRGGGTCSPVCLDLTVGLTAVREPSPASGDHLEIDCLTSGGGAASMMTNDEARMMEAKLTQVSEENRRLTEMIAYLYGTQIARLGLDGSGSPPPRASPQPPASKKRGRESMETSNSCNAANHVDSPASDDGSCKRIKVSRVCTRIDPSDTNLVVKDGYQWRKYGQKVTRDNPSPRAYFRCAFSPSCPVKKKVQRSAEDSGMLVATYEGDHNHPYPSRAGELLPAAAAARSGSVPCSISINSSGPTITLDLTKNGGGVQVVKAEAAAPDLREMCREVASPEFRKALVDQMAGALASAILQKLPDY